MVPVRDTLRWFCVNCVCTRFQRERGRYATPGHIKDIHMWNDNHRCNLDYVMESLYRAIDGLPLLPESKVSLEVILHGISVSDEDIIRRMISFYCSISNTKTKSDFTLLHRVRDIFWFKVYVNMLNLFRTSNL